MSHSLAFIKNFFHSGKTGDHFVEACPAILVTLRHELEIRPWQAGYCPFLKSLVYIVATRQL
jgi:hypothetical protein